MAISFRDLILEGAGNWVKGWQHSELLISICNTEDPLAGIQQYTSSRGQSGLERKPCWWDSFAVYTSCHSLAQTTRLFASKYVECGGGTSRREHLTYDSCGCLFPRKLCRLELSFVVGTPIDRLMPDSR